MSVGTWAAPVRKYVVVLFVDIVGSTALGEAVDPEALRANLARYFDAVSAVIWKHGGTVEKFIGDAVMAVFGVPQTREDDAVRALHAAGEIHVAVAGLSTQMQQDVGRSLTVRVGVNGGEVFVTHQPDGQFSVTGDAVNTAQRLEASAGEGETYVGASVAELVQGHVALESVGLVVHKGKSVPQEVFRLTRDQSALPGRDEVPFVGRAEALAELTSMAERSDARRQGWFLTLVGEAGIGKTRLIAQFLAGRPSTRVLRGSSQPMDQDTYAPLVQMLTQLADETDVTELMGEDAEHALLPLRSAIGRSDAQTSTDDVAWAFRGVVSRLVQERPLVLVWDDLHWATEPQLDLVQRLAQELRSLPVLSICVTRPDLFERRPQWGGGRQSRVEDLEPLDEDELRAIAEGQLAQASELIDVDKLIVRSDGNPLVLQMLVQCACDGESLPVSVHTLFEAALDRLSPAERRLCEGGSVFGREFDPAAAAAVVEDWTEHDPRVVADRLRELKVLEPGRHHRRASQDSYRFMQSLLMQTAYESIPKQVRSRRHERAAEWLSDRHAPGVSETSTAVATHYDKAWTLLAEVNGPAAEREALREKAVQAAIRHARALRMRGDPGAKAVYERLQEILAPGDRRHIHAALGVFLFVGRGRDADFIRDRMAVTDRALPDDPAWAVVRHIPSRLIDRGHGIGAPEDLLSDVEAVRRSLDDLDDVPAAARYLALAYEGQVLADAGMLRGCLDVVRRGLDLSLAEGDQVEERVFRSFLLQVEFSGNEPLETSIRTAERLRADYAGDRYQSIVLDAVLTGAYACVGDQEAAQVAWKRVETAHAGIPNHAILEREYHAQMLEAAGDVKGAAREWAELSRDIGDNARLATSLACMASRYSLRSGDLEASLRYADEARRVAGDQHAQLAESNLSPVGAVLAAIAGDADGARRHLDAARVETKPEESLVDAGQLAVYTAIVLRLLGDEPGAQASMKDAKRLFDRKGAVALADLVDTWVGHAERLRAGARQLH
ncbi:hypothetical protein VV02_09805 [Luteipulveratus mongoliensis]|uniref:Guanylate cyclase domain-containing protein n=1 Tax=Luteipulveratus mongoliensis TaxID=571913 RepID=A0A0K1JH91_9MICO|nr:hypothetical protein VV02_09805 [Luteipulveratus mongoliensis]